MSTLQIFIICACAYIILACLLFRTIMRADPLRSCDGHTEDVTGGTAPATETRDAHAYRLVDVDSPPVTLKLLPSLPDSGDLVVCKRVLLITGCSDPLLWYSRLVGQEVPYLGMWTDEGCFKSREPAGYINAVKFKDARIVVKEAGK